MHTLPEVTIDLLKYLNSKGVSPLLYGSQGVSLYLGAFKQFSDIDLLVADEYLNEQWPTLISIMSSYGFPLIDEHEHSFRNAHGVEANFAAESILTRDNILDSVDDIVIIQTPQWHIKTLTPKSFKRAYSYSLQDGYRKDVRGKNDEIILKLLDQYIASL